MKRYISVILVAANVVLALLLAWMWFSPSGGLKNVHWTMPRGQKSNLDNIVPRLGKAQAMDHSQFLAMLDRPLFSSTRRPPPPPPAAVADAPPPPPDYLADAVLTGVYIGEDGKSGGIIIHFQGKDKSLPLRGTLDGWTLSSVADNRVYFTRDGLTKEIALQKGKLQQGYTPAAEPGVPQRAMPPQIGQPPAGSDTPTPRRRASIGGTAAQRP
ncbi:MAG: hypothetical protein LBE58_15615 [Comamonas sp.]|jgi:type II secretory pathway component PulC|uniref:Type II secretion system protein GspC N-terminal domain-containing protein n=1 Tax=Comamonas koreensis TaxID=160825 RepID=A0AAW4Y1M6_9BURK|nr:hypothetical protein [Comamonas koreensis]MCD2167193.1 hypothetical protein [Comamonas koreensis]MDR2331031.1 hypothetical protein [Comamonas sp.]